MLSRPSDFALFDLGCRHPYSLQDLFSVWRPRRLFRKDSDHVIQGYRLPGSSAHNLALPAVFFGRFARIPVP